MSNKAKVLCIGLDGATFDLIRPWVEAGKLPQMKKIMLNGVWGELESVIPPISAPAWTSFMTGKNPGKHGIFGFKKEKQGTYQEIFVNRKLIKSKSLWKRLSDDEQKVIVINVPLTYPPEEVKGCLVSGMDAPSKKSPYTYPSELKNEIEKVTGNKYKIHLHLGGYLINEKRKKQALEEVMSVIDARVKVAEYLMQKHQWDFFMIKFDNPDQVQHYFWKEMNQKESPLQEAILKIYQHLDSILARLIKYMDKDTTLIVLSDHGAGPVNNKRIYINEWLRRNGMYFTKDHTCVRRKGLGGRFKVKKLLAKLLDKAYFTAGKIISYRIRDRLGIFLPTLKGRFRSFTFGLNTDWTKTKAYSGGNPNAIYINLEGRKPSGIVKLGEEYEQLRDEIIRGLKYLIDPENGEPAFEHVYKREEIYHGPDLEGAPDILLYPRNFSDYTLGKEILNDVHKPVIAYHPSPKGITGNHRLKGIFLIQGPSIKSGEFIKGMRIIDLFPTIYYLLGLKVPDDIDGRILTSIFCSEWISQNPIQFSRSVDSIMNDGNVDVYSEQDEKEIYERLSGLGYL